MSNKTPRKSTKTKPVLLAGGNPQIAKAEGNAPVQAYIAAMPGWKRDVGRRLDALIVHTVRGVHKAVKWNSPFYGVNDQGWFLSFHCFTNYVKVTFFRGTSLRPLPPGESKHKDVRYLDIYEDDQPDDAQLTAWVKQPVIARLGQCVTASLVLTPSASDAVPLLQILEDGILTDSLGNQADFRNTLIIMTSNLGTRFLTTKGHMGFREKTAEGDQKSAEQLINQELKKEFSPEFINLIVDIIIFNQLSQTELRQICRLLIDDVNLALIHRNVSIHIDDIVVDWLLKRAEEESNSGARPLRRAIQRYIEDELSEFLIRHKDSTLSERIEFTMNGDEVLLIATPHRELSRPSTSIRAGFDGEVQLDSFRKPDGMTESRRASSGHAKNRVRAFRASA